MFWVLSFSIVLVMIFKEIINVAFEVAYGTELLIVLLFSFHLQGRGNRAGLGTLVRQPHLQSLLFYSFTAFICLFCFSGTLVDFIFGKL